MENKKQLFFSGAKWENYPGYRKYGNVMEISRPAAGGGDIIIGKGSMYEQAGGIYKKWKKLKSKPLVM